MTIEAPLADALEWLFRTRAPAAIQAKAREVVLDTFGCVLAARRHPEVAAFGAALEAADPGSASSAAAGFAAAACWDEACEGLARAHGRPGLTVLGALHALAKNRPFTLEEVLDAYLTGYEVGARLGETMRVGPGMHVDGAWTSFGVAAAVVRLLGGNAAQALDAIRIAACQMPYSLYLPVAAGANARNTYLAHGAQLGMLAANSALGGISAPQGALVELQSRALAGAPPGPALAPPGQWLISETYLKPYAAVRHVHYGAAAAQALRADIKKRLKEIRGIQLSTYAEALAYCGNRAPRSAIQAQFSLSYGLACMLVTGELSPDSYSAETLAREDIRVLEALVELSEREDLTITGRRGASLSIDLRHESLMYAVENIPGDPGNPMPRVDILLKFARYSGQLAARGAEFLDAAAERRFSEVSPL